MATNKPRITVTFDPRTYEVLSRMAASQGESMSQLVAGLVDLCVPSFERVLAVVERAAKAPDEVKEGLKSALDRAERELLPQLIEAAKQSDMFLAGLASDAPDAGRSKRSAVRPSAPESADSGGSTPVPVTRGSGGGPRGVPSAKRGARKGASRGTV